MPHYTEANIQDLYCQAPCRKDSAGGTTSGRRNAVRKLTQLASETRNEVRPVHLRTKALIAEMNVPQ